MLPIQKKRGLFMQTSNKIRELVMAALLTALAIVIPLFMPKLPVPQPFSVTPASHLAVILSMFISPFTAICTVIGSTIAFFVALGPVVAMRAFSHLLFALLGCYLIKKRYNLFITILLTGILHAIGEIIVVSIFACFGMASGTAQFVWGITGGITFFHHCFDFVLSMVVFFALKSAKLLNTPITLKKFKG